MTGVYPSALVEVGHVEPVPRRIRAELAGTVVVDTTSALYVWESTKYPQYYIPRIDVAAEALVVAERVQHLKRGSAHPVGLQVGDVERPDAGRLYVAANPPQLAGRVRFDWSVMDAWFEEDEQVFVHPRSPYVRVDALRSTRRVRIELDGVVLAESSAPVIVFETALPPRYYLDRSALHLEHLVTSDTVTECPYKGRTTGYWSVRIGETLHPDLAWTYDFPTAALLPIAGLIAFYDEKIDVIVDGVLQERPRTPFS